MLSEIKKIKNQYQHQNTQKRDSEKISISHQLNHIYLAMFFFRVMLKTVYENLISTLTNKNVDVYHL